jgi:hypothetical protein
LIDTIPDVAGGDISPSSDSFFHPSPIPEVAEPDLFQWTDLPTPSNLSQALLGAAEPSPAAPPPTIRLRSNPLSQPPTGAVCIDDCNCPTSDDSDGDATSCALAYQMVLQSNAKGLDMVEIQIRLWNGFRKGKNGSNDCAVDNKVLFELLDYISS